MIDPNSHIFTSNGARVVYRGLALADIPPNAKGFTWEMWERYQWDQVRTAALANAPPVELKAAAIARDDYGWRGMVRTSPKHVRIGRDVTKPKQNGSGVQGQ